MTQCTGTNLRIRKTNIITHHNIMLDYIIVVNYTILTECQPAYSKH